MQRDKSASMNDGKKLIRKSTAEFIIFTGQAGEQSIEARYEDETIWLSQKLMASLFDVDVRTVNEHLKNVYEQREVTPETTIRKFRIVQTKGKREVARNVEFYNLKETSFHILTVKDFLCHLSVFQSSILRLS